MLRGRQEVAEVDGGRARRGGGCLQEDGGLSAQTVLLLLLEDAHITALPSSPRLLRSIQTVCVPVASHHRGEQGVKEEAE